MEQKFIRKYNGETYTVTEGSEIIEELDARTQSSRQGYNSIDELGEKMVELEQAQEQAFQDVVRYTPQNKTALEKKEARKNIGLDFNELNADPLAYYNTALNS